MSTDDTVKPQPKEFYLLMISRSIDNDNSQVPTLPTFIGQTHPTPPSKCHKSLFHLYSSHHTRPYCSHSTQSQ